MLDGEDSEMIEACRGVGDARAAIFSSRSATAEINVVPRSADEPSSAASSRKARASAVAFAAQSDNRASSADMQSILLGMVQDREEIAAEIGRKIRGMICRVHSPSARSVSCSNTCSNDSLGRSPQYRRTIRYTLMTSSA